MFSQSGRRTLAACVRMIGLAPNMDSVLAAKGKTFHWARRLLGSHHGTRATRLYAFCRAVDDFADESASHSTARTALVECERAIKLGESYNLQFKDMLELMRECKIDSNIVLELIRGVATDLEPVHVGTVDELLHYCYRVAGTVGLMMCRVLDVDDSAAYPHAIDLGIAMQLTNICRDVGLDASCGRRYLPAELIGDIPASLLEIPSSSLRPKLQRSIAELLQLADTYYSSGERGLAYLPLEARGAILVAGRTYRAIGTRLLRHGGDYWSQRIVVPPLSKLGITCQSLLTRPLQSAFWRRPWYHDVRLHTALAGLPCVSGSDIARYGG